MILNRHCWDSMLSLAMNYASPFFAEGKAASRNMVKNENFINGFQEFSLPWEILQEVSNVIKKYLCSIYGFSCSSVIKVTKNVQQKMTTTKITRPLLAAPTL